MNKLNLKHSGAALAMAAVLTTSAYGSGFTEDQVEDFLGGGRNLFSRDVHEHIKKVAQHQPSKAGAKVKATNQEDKSNANEEDNEQVEARKRLVAAREYWAGMHWFRYAGLHWGGRRLRSNSQRAKGLFSLLDADKNGKIVPKEIFKAYYTMNKSYRPEDELSIKDFKNAIDGSLRKFCGVGPAAANEEEYFNTMFNKQGRNQRFQARKRAPVYNRNKNYGQPDNRRRGRNSRNSRRGQRQQNQWQQRSRQNNKEPSWTDIANNGQNTALNEELQEENFENFGASANGRGLRSVNWYNNSGNRSSGRRSNSRRSRRGQFNNNRSSRNNRFGRRQNYNNSRRNFSGLKKLLRRKMSLYGLIDTDHNQTISLFEFFKPFSSADSNKDFAVTKKELGNYLVKHERRICMLYKYTDRIKRQQAWFKKGVNAGIGKLRPKRNNRKANNNNSRKADMSP